MKKFKVKVLILAAAISINCAFPTFAEWIQNEQGLWRYYNEDGTLVTNEWRLSGQYWFYMDSNGDITRNTLVESDGNTYYVNNDGAMATNQWITYNGSDYYAGNDGAFLKSTVTPDGYTVDSNGAWISNISRIVSKPDYSTLMVKDTKPRAQAIVIYIVNHSNATMTITKDFASLHNPGYDNLQSELTLVDEDARPVERVDIQPNEEKIICYLVNNRNGVWYDKDSILYFKFSMSDVDYLGAVQPNGYIYNKILNE